MPTRQRRLLRIALVLAAMLAVLFGTAYAANAGTYYDMKPTHHAQTGKPSVTYYDMLRQRPSETYYDL